MTIFAVKDSGGGSMMTLVWSIIALTIFDYIFKSLPTIVATVGEVIRHKYKKSAIIPTISPAIKSRIVFERFYTQKSDDNITDAILNYVCKQDEAMDLVYNHFYLVNKEDVFELTKDLSVKVIAKTFSKEGNLLSLKFEVFSYTWSLTKMKKWVNKINKEYEIEKKNKFGDKRYFFDEYIPERNIGMPVAPHLFFTMTEFHTNKSLSNTYGKHLRIVKERVDLFVNHPEWYEEKGIPHTLGLLLHGPPGTGKTSLIKAIANDTERHIFNIKLRDTTLPEQLNDLFYNENVKLKVGMNMNQTVVVPLNKRIYVIEDIDCLTDIVLERSLATEKEKDNDSDGEEEQKINERFTRIDEPNEYSCGSYSKKGLSERQIFGSTAVKDKKKNQEERKLTLSFILNLLDGVLETPGRILVMTSNYPDRLDKALIRPGRVDINLHLGYCDDNMIKEMFEGFFGSTKHKFASLTSKEFTPAKVQAILCNNFNDPVKAYEEICA
uniref:AAA+ ATPase domain-containing protein n=1 Tax=viral metagenome TaxID=1070528 RepID=A0A6C0EJI0_9ZZZZ